MSAFRDALQMTAEDEREILWAGAECMREYGFLSQKLKHLREASFTKAEILLNEVHHGIDLPHYRATLKRVQALAKKHLVAMFSYGGADYSLNGAASLLAGALQEAEQYDVA